MGNRIKYRRKNEVNFGIGEIYFGLEAPLDGAVSLVKQRCSEESREFSSCSCPQVYGGVLRNESKELFKKYLERNENAPEFVKNLALS